MVTARCQYITGISAMHAVEAETTILGGEEDGLVGFFFSIFLSLTFCVFRSEREKEREREREWTE